MERGREIDIEMLRDSVRETVTKRKPAHILVCIKSEMNLILCALILSQSLVTNTTVMHVREKTALSIACYKPIPDVP